MSGRTGKPKAAFSKRVSKAKEEKPDLKEFFYPSAKLLSGETRAKDVRMAELECKDEWTTALSYYERALSERGWVLFESHRFADRGTSTFRHEKFGTVTILSVAEADSTHIKIFLKAQKAEG